MSYATTFDEYVDWLATNSPHAAIMDWWRRVDRAVQFYYEQRGRVRPRRRVLIEDDISTDPSLGPDVALLFRELRQRRNEVAHEDVGSLSREDAIEFAQEAHRLGWALLAAENP